MNRIATTAAATIIGGFALLALTACQAGLDGAGVPPQAASVASAVQAAAQHQPATDAGQASSSDPSTAAAMGTTPPATAGAPALGPVAIGSGTLSTPGALSTTAARSGTVAQSTTVAPSGTVAPSTAGVVVTTTAARKPGSGSGPGTGQQTGAGNSSGTGDQGGSTSTGDPSGSDVHAHAATRTSEATTPAPSFVSASISCDYSESDKSYHENLSYEVANATGMALSIDNPGIVGSFGSYDWHGTIEIPNLGCYAINGAQTYTLYTLGGTGQQASRTIVRTGTYTAITPPPFSQPTRNTTAPLPTPSASTPDPLGTATLTTVAPLPTVPAAEPPTPDSASSATASTTGN